MQFFEISQASNVSDAVSKSFLTFSRELKGFLDSLKSCYITSAKFVSNSELYSGIPELFICTLITVVAYFFSTSMMSRLESTGLGKTDWYLASIFCSENFAPSNLLLTSSLKSLYELNFIFTIFLTHLVHSLQYKKTPSVVMNVIASGGFWYIWDGPSSHPSLVTLDRYISFSNGLRKIGHVESPELSTLDLVIVRCTTYMKLFNKFEPSRSLAFT